MRRGDRTDSGPELSPNGASREGAGGNGASAGGVASGGLKLKIADAEDLAVVSAVLQDAVVVLGDMTYLAGERVFAVVANRFRWEECDDDGQNCASFERVNCGIAFQNVDGVKVRNIDQKDRDRYLDLLALRTEGGEVRLVFAGGAEVRLDVASLEGHIADMGEPWPTPNRPHHDTVDQS